MIYAMKCPKCAYTYWVDWPEPHYEQCPMCGRHGPMNDFTVKK
jgi:uncharacterized OB-fold protein